MKSYIFILLFCIGFPVLLSAQSNGKTQSLMEKYNIGLPAFMKIPSLGKAQKQMDKYNYSAAIEILKQDTANAKLRSQAMIMLAECYRLQHDVVTTLSTYAKVVDLPDAKAESFFFYAQALQSTGNYEKARQVFLKYSEKNPYTNRGDLFIVHCDSVLGPWKGISPRFEMKAVANINTSESEFGPAFYDGNLVFASDFTTTTDEGKRYGWTGRGYLNIVKSKPLEAGDFWGIMGLPMKFDSVFKNEYHEGPSAFNAKGSCIYFTRSFYGKAILVGKYQTNLLKIFYAYKIDSAWAEIQPFSLNSTKYSVGHPALSADGWTLYFASDMSGGIGGTDIWMCKRERETWGPPVNLGPTVNTTENEMFPSIGNNGKLYFASEGHPGYGALDIFETSFINGVWTTPVNLHPPINSPCDDFALAFAPGSKGGFFSSNRPGGAGSDDIYAFQVAEPPVVVPIILPSYIEGIVKDKNTLLPLADATVFLLNPANGKVKVLKTNAEGIYKTIIETPSEYVVKAMISNYIADCTPIHVKELKPGSNSVASRDLLLDKMTINKIFQIDNIYYDFEKSQIRYNARPELDKLVRIMNENDISVELGSHTDSRGSFSFNDKLSQGRAKSAVRYIILSGIDKSRITAKGYGERQLTNNCSDGVRCTEAEHQANRRTEFKIISLSETKASAQQFNLGLYSEGQEIKSEMLPTDFFVECK